MERTEDRRQLRILVVIDEFTRESLAMEVARSFTAWDVIMTLQYLFAVRVAPEHLRSNNGPEFVLGNAASCVSGRGYPLPPTHHADCSPTLS